VCARYSAMAVKTRIVGLDGPPMTDGMIAVEFKVRRGCDTVLGACTLRTRRDLEESLRLNAKVMREAWVVAAI